MSKPQTTEPRHLFPKLMTMLLLGILVGVALGHLMDLPMPAGAKPPCPCYGK